MFPSRAPRKNRDFRSRRPQVETCEGRLLLSSLVAHEATTPQPAAIVVSLSSMNDVELIKHGWHAPNAITFTLPSTHAVESIKQGS